MLPANSLLGMFLLVLSSFASATSETRTIDGREVRFDLVLSGAVAAAATMANDGTVYYTEGQSNVDANRVFKWRCPRCPSTLLATLTAFGTYLGTPYQSFFESLDLTTENNLLLAAHADDDNHFGDSSFSLDPKTGKIRELVPPAFEVQPGFLASLVSPVINGNGKYVYVESATVDGDEEMAGIYAVSRSGLNPLLRIGDSIAGGEVVRINRRIFRMKHEILTEIVLRKDGTRKPVVISINDNGAVNQISEQFPSPTIYGTAYTANRMEAVLTYFNLKPGISSVLYRYRDGKLSPLLATGELLLGEKVTSFGVTAIGSNRLLVDIATASGSSLYMNDTRGWHRLLTRGDELSGDRVSSASAFFAGNSTVTRNQALIRIYTDTKQHKMYRLSF